MTDNPENQASSSDSQTPHDHNVGPSQQPKEVLHVHEGVKDVDELIAAMDHVDEGMPEEHDEDESEEEESDREEAASSKTKESAPESSKESEVVRSAKERLAHIKSKLMTLQWDVEHGQINPAKKAMFDKLKQEGEALAKVINESGNAASSKN